MHVGEGIYTLAEAAALLRLPTRRLSRWVNGYVRDGVSYAPLWRSSMVWESDGESISFADLMEARVVAAFHGTGVRIPVIREAIDRARSEYGEERPLSTRRFRTDGRRLFGEVAGARTAPSSESGLVDVGLNQGVFRSVVEPALRDVEFEGDSAARWWPLDGRRIIVLDRARSFGRPIDATSGVPAHVLHDALGEPGAAEGETPRAAYRGVARLYGVPEKVVREAEVFSRRFAA